METLGELVKEGKIRYIGLSDCSEDVLRRAKAVAGAGDKLVACQTEFSPFDIRIETSGFVAAARELGVSIVPYSPLGRGTYSLRSISPLLTFWVITRHDHRTVSSNDTERKNITDRP